MKTGRKPFLILLSLLSTRGADAISTEEFSRIRDEGQRTYIIEHAPPEQKEELKKIDLHLALLARYGGEGGLKAARESKLVRARGLGSLEVVFKGYLQFVDIFAAESFWKNEKSGMALDKQALAEKVFREKEDDIKKHLAIVHSLVFRISASPRALELNEEAGKLGNDLEKRLWYGPAPRQPISREERIAVDKQMDQIFEEMKKLPTLTSEQAQKEYDEFTDDKMRQNY
jgi:hypothetical protein